MIYMIQNQYLSVSASQKGAELWSIQDKEGTEYLWQGNPAYWEDRAPHLFPYVARLTGGKYRLDGQEYAMRIHGFAPYSEFALAEQTETKLTLALSANPDTLLEYPRQFTFRVIYDLLDNVLAVTYEVENRDNRRMYFGLGGHPGLQVPLRAGKRFEDYRLRFGRPCQPQWIGFSDDCFVDGTEVPFPLQDGQYLPLDHALFDHDAIVLKDAARQVTLETEGDPRSVTVSFPSMPYVGFWHQPKTDAPYVCIEPWCSLPSDKGKPTVFEQKEDLVSLAPGQLYQNTWTIQINGLL